MRGATASERRLAGLGTGTRTLCVSTAHEEKGGVALGTTKNMEEPRTQTSGRNETMEQGEIKSGEEKRKQKTDSEEWRRRGLI